MVQAISSYNGSSDELYQIRKALLEENSKGKLSSKKTEDTQKELSKKEVEKEIRLSSRDEEVEESEEENLEDEPNENDGKIVVDASEISALDVQTIDANVKVESEETEAEYDEEMDYDKDGKVSDEERIRYYSEKYKELDNDIQKTSTDEKFDANAHTPSVNKNTTNPINANMSLINKMQMSYGQTTPIIQSGLQILV